MPAFTDTHPRPVNTTTTVTDPDETCPGCETTNGVRATPVPPRVQAWTCTACGLDWAITTVNPAPRPAHLADLGAAAEEIGRLRWKLRQVIALADDAPGLTNEQLRHRLLTLAESCAR